MQKSTAGRRSCGLAVFQPLVAGRARWSRLSRHSAARSHLLGPRLGSPGRTPGATISARHWSSSMQVPCFLLGHCPLLAAKVACSLPPNSRGNCTHLARCGNSVFISLLPATPACLAQGVYTCIRPYPDLYKKIEPLGSSQALLSAMHMLCRGLSAGMVGRGGLTFALTAESVCVWGGGSVGVAKGRTSAPRCQLLASFGRRQSGV